MIFSIAMDAHYSFYVKTIETHARTFLTLNISAIGRGRTQIKIQQPEKKLGRATFAKNILIRKKNSINMLPSVTIYEQ